MPPKKLPSVSSPATATKPATSDETARAKSTPARTTSKKTAEASTRARAPAKKPTPAKTTAATTPRDKATAATTTRAQTPSAQASPAKASKSQGAAAKPVLLAGGNPQIAKADGDAPVEAYIAALPGWKSELVRRLDALVVRTVPGVEKAVKWNSPFYGVAGKGWFLSLHAFTKYVKLAFFRGASLRPLPPGESSQKEARYLDLHERDPLDQELLASWLRQAAAIPGWDGAARR